MWDWLESLEGGAANFIGSFTGAVVGLLAILIGALFNAHLNRRRDDQLKEADARAIAAALNAELEGIDKTLLNNAKSLEEGDTEFMVADVAHQIRIMPHLLPKLGLLDDSDAIQQIIGAYGSVDKWLERLVMIGGVIMDEMPSHRRVVRVPKGRAELIAKMNRNISKKVREAIERLDKHLE